MKLTDFALVFLGILLPVVLVIYVNVSYTIKATEQEVYYQSLIDSAIKDASIRMKQVENEDSQVDYGYSGLIEGKVSANAQIAYDTFFSSLSNNLNTNDNEGANLQLKYYIPVFAVVDYNGVSISSMEQFDNAGKTVFDHVMKPKVYYSYTYAIDSSKNLVTDLDIINANYNNTDWSIHHIEFTMSDYIVHRGKLNDRLGIVIPYETKGFYITDRDTGNNVELYDNEPTLADEIEEHLTNIRLEVIASTIATNLNYYANKHNTYANSVGINYAFAFSTEASSDMYNYVNDVGVLALVQGMSIGNKYLNYKAYSTTNLNVATKYYLSIPGADSKINKNLYHKDPNCPEYQASISNTLVPSFVESKKQAASVKVLIPGSTLMGIPDERVEGFYPCPFCNP